MLIEEVKIALLEIGLPGIDTLWDSLDCATRNIDMTRIRSGVHTTEDLIHAQTVERIVRDQAKARALQEASTYLLGPSQVRIHETRTLIHKIYIMKRHRLAEITSPIQNPL